MELIELTELTYLTELTELTEPTESTEPTERTDRADRTNRNRTAYPYSIRYISTQYQTHQHPQQSTFNRSTTDILYQVQLSAVFLSLTTKVFIKVSFLANIAPSLT